MQLMHSIQVLGLYSGLSSLQANSKLPLPWRDRLSKRELNPITFITAL